MPNRLKTSAFFTCVTVATLLKVTCLGVVEPNRALAGIETSRSEAVTNREYILILFRYRVLCPVLIIFGISLILSLI